MICHHFAKFGGHRYCINRDVFIVCDVCLCDSNHMFKLIGRNFYLENFEINI